MLEFVLKYQFRKGVFLLPLLMVIMGYVESMEFLFLFIIYTKFCNIFKQPDFHFKLIYMNGSIFKSLLKAYNISWIVWLNLWYLALVILRIIFLQVSLKAGFIDLLAFNAILIPIILVGNFLSNSDLVTIRNRAIRYLATIFFYGIVLSASSLVILSIKQFYPFFNLLIIIIALLMWQSYIKQFVNPKFMENFLND